MTRRIDVCPEPEQLDPDPRVAQAGWRYPSTSEPGLFHDVALMADGTWLCHCWSFLGADECLHVHDARARWHARRDCEHGLVVTDDTERLCVLCGVAYDRAAFLERLRADIIERFRARRRAPSSPWSAAERSADP